MAADIRTDWSRAEVGALYRRPLLELIYDAATLHRRYHDPREVQLCTLLSVKTGGCPEDCAYCPQSAHYRTGVVPTRLMAVEEVVARARQAQAAGSTRFCLGAAWREVRDGRDFDRVLAMVREVRALGLEVCCTLGMLTAEQARRLAEAGLTAYNHNLDTSAEFYPRIITTRRYEERLRTLEHVRAAGISVCCGGIIGMGESEADRIAFLHTLATLSPHPESVPINALVRVEGTPLADRPPVEPFELVRMVAVARILMPASIVRLSAGRLSLSPEAQALAFLAGANSIFTGDRLLTTPNPGLDADRALLATLGLVPRPAAAAAGAPLP
ncbi:MAG TPA: biotin synthase BioB [Thermodesulfobacteriota bacterium]|nr:biotin synthase BioB [Thermodesulfobacteriota bacterium]